MLFEAPPAKKRFISLTPLIDVVFLLLIFFMLASTFLEVQALNVSVPAGERAAEEADRVLVEMRLKADGTIWLEGEAISPDNLILELDKENTKSENLSVRVVVEPGAPTQSLVLAMEATRRAGIEAVGLAKGRAPGP